MRVPTPLRFVVLIIAALLACAATAEAQTPGGLGCAGGAGESCRPPAETGSPVDDLASALDRLADARDASAAAAARAEALAILEGTPLPGRAYSGIPLLNWNAPAKVRTVPADGAPVEIREVRFPGHALTDAWLLEFADPSKPYTIRYRITELGGSMGGELKPAPLLADGGTRMGSTHEALLPLVPPQLATGGMASNRFTVARGVGSVPETTRLAEQVIDVNMPAPGMTRAILHPSGGPYSAAGATAPRPPALFTLQPASTARRDVAARALGFDSADPSPAERTQAIER